MIAIIESPYAAPNREVLDRNEAYLNACMKDSLARGEYPYASHGYLPRVLCDGVHHERRLGLEAGRAITKALLETGQARWVFCIDHGMSPGMVETLIQLHESAPGDMVVFRSVSLDREMTPNELIKALWGAISDVALDVDTALRQLAEQAPALVKAR